MMPALCWWIASCSAEAVRISPRTATFHKGQLVWGVAGYELDMSATVNSKRFKPQEWGGLSMSVLAEMDIIFEEYALIDVV